ncbi:tyrosine-type recombinase/integrase [Thermoplasma volcanium]|uniref:tyrosine-type recombinase/integrase n=1 Tax=Thermoplasma volcanium TaxID=50339 RepID=UPI0012E9A36A|nr:tyrosine-type recombinase/integrase [Thermoplasma volcanium]
MITETEMQRILTVLKNPRDRAFISSLYDSGCRIEELITLKNRDISFDQYGSYFQLRERLVTERSGLWAVQLPCPCS